MTANEKALLRIMQTDREHFSMRPCDKMHYAGRDATQGRRPQPESESEDDDAEA
jgi:hypothetical protein